MLITLHSIKRLLSVFSLIFKLEGSHLKVGVCRFIKVFKVLLSEGQNRRRRFGEQAADFRRLSASN